MNRRCRDTTMGTFCASRSRRQVLATAAKGALGGAGAAMLGGGITPGLLGSDLVPSAKAQGVTVSIFDAGFEPATIEVPVGTEVTWTNNGQPVPEGQPNNTVTSVDCGVTFNSGQIDLGATFSHTFTTAGAFPYQNAVNPFAMGMVTVTAAPKTHVRRNLHSLAADSPELKAYACAVGEMKKRELTDPTSWLYQAYIHGMPLQAQQDLIDELGITTVEEYVAALGERGWLTCEHHTSELSIPYFWPWHRMYLYWFERIVRELGEDPDFALPYWDYLDADQRVLPEPFRDPTNPLYVERRDPALNGGGIPNLSAEEENAVFGNICAGLMLSNYLGASNELETTPHDYIHGWVGGSFANPPMLEVGLMGLIATSAQDPLFWLHHANLDRLWASWRALGGSDPPDEAWLKNDVNSGVFEPLTLPYTFFDETGTKVTMVRVVNQVLDTFALGYTYDDLFTPIVRLCRPCVTSPAGPEAAPIATPAATLHAPVELGRSEPDERIAIGPDPVAIPVTLQPPEEAVSAVEQGQEVVLTLEDVRGEGVPGTLFEVYINLPEGQEADFRSPYFVGNLSLFGLQPQDMGPMHLQHTATRRFNISRNIAALQERGEWTGDVTVTIVPYYAGSRAPIEAAGTTPEADATPAETQPPEGPWVTFEDVTVARQ